MLWVPLPWWTSQSMIITLDTPCFACRYRAVIAALFRRQNPIPSARPAWCPGGGLGRGYRNERLEEADALEMFVNCNKAIRRFRVCEWGGVEQIVRMVDIRDLFHQD